jgi:hypothetical protein
MSERLETILWLKGSLWLRPRTGALRGGLCHPATTGNFGIRVKWSAEHCSASVNLGSRGAMLRAPKVANGTPREQCPNQVGTARCAVRAASSGARGEVLEMLGGWGS